MHIMTKEELRAIAGASGVGDAVGCAGAIGAVVALVATDGAAAPAIRALLATTAGKATVFSAVAGMASGCINLYDDYAPPEWQSGQLLSDFVDIVGTLYDYGVQVQNEIFYPDYDEPDRTGHVEIIYEGETVGSYDYDFNDGGYQGT